MKEFDLCEVVFEFMGSKLFDMVNGTNGVLFYGR
jgi:hypothetical protein